MTTIATPLKSGEYRVEGAISIYENWDCLQKDYFELIFHEWIKRVAIALAIFGAVQLDA